MTILDSATLLPDRFGLYGGSYVPETLAHALSELEFAYIAARNDPAFLAEVDDLLKHFVGRATPLTDAPRLTRYASGARIVLKREDLAHTGAHKINNTVGQIILAKKLGKKRIIAETGAGQHGVATATVCALMGMDCTIYMGELDIKRQRPNVERMRILGAKIVPAVSLSLIHI